MNHRLRRISIATAVCCALTTACADQDNNPTGPPQASRFGRPDIIVPAGSSIQAAIDAAGPNSVIQLEPGLNAQGVVVTQPGVKIVGVTDHDGNGAIIENPALDFAFSVSADGRRFLYHARNPDASAREIHVILNWFEELKTKAKQ